MGGSLGKRKGDISQYYDITSKLGTGSFAVVRKCTRKKDQKEFAVKIVKKKNLNTEELATIHDEVEILGKVNHPHIVRLEEIFETSKNLFMVLELLTGGELFDRIVELGSFSEKEAAKVVLQICKALKYMHSQGVVHRDLKPENLIYSVDDKSGNNVIKITDFGLAKIVSQSASMSTPCGTPGYVAPEVLKSEPYGKEVDLWSVGVIMYILMCGFPPFYADSAGELYAQIKKGEYDFPSPYWDDVSDSAKDLIRKLLTVDPKKRADVDFVLNNSWALGQDASSSPMGDKFNKNLKLFNARRKLRKAITMVLALNKLARHVGIFEFGDGMMSDSEIKK